MTNGKWQNDKMTVVMIPLTIWQDDKMTRWQESMTMAGIALIARPFARKIDVQCSEVDVASQSCSASRRSKQQLKMKLRCDHQPRRRQNKIIPQQFSHTNWLPRFRSFDVVRVKWNWFWNINQELVEKQFHFTSTQHTTVWLKWSCFEVVNQVSQKTNFIPAPGFCQFDAFESNAMELLPLVYQRPQPLGRPEESTIIAPWRPHRQETRDKR